MKADKPPLPPGLYRKHTPAILPIKQASQRMTAARTAAAADASLLEQLCRLPRRPLLLGDAYSHLHGPTRHTTRDDDTHKTASEHDDNTGAPHEFHFLNGMAAGTNRLLMARQGALAKEGVQLAPPACG